MTEPPDYVKALEKFRRAIGRFWFRWPFVRLAFREAWLAGQQRGWYDGFKASEAFGLQPPTPNSKAQQAATGGGSADAGDSA